MTQQHIAFAFENRLYVCNTFAKRDELKNQAYPPIIIFFISVVAVVVTAAVVRSNDKKGSKVEKRQSRIENPFVQGDPKPNEKRKSITLRQ